MITAIIQARMGSKRLPGKVLKRVGDTTLLGYQLKRVNGSRLIDRTVVATSTTSEDDAIASFCKENNSEYFRGAENDVLSRYYECARNYNADIVVRLTGDCPLSDPRIIDDTIKFYKDRIIDYVANTIPPETSRYPDGTDVEVFSMKALKKAHDECADNFDREHVTFYFWKYGKDFKTAQLRCHRDFSKYRFTVDYPEDLEVVEFVIQELKKRNSFGHMEEIVEIIDSNPEIKEKNSKYYAGIGWRQ